MRLEEKIIEILKEDFICDNCLGRFFSELLSGFSNKERGRILRNYLAFLLDSGEKIDVDTSNFYGIKFRNIKLEIREPEKCKICGNFFEKEIDELAKKIVEELKGIEFQTFLIGSIPRDEMLNEEEKLQEKVGIEFSETIKSEINRELGKRVEKLSGKIFSLQNPDITIIVNLKTGKIKKEIRSLYIYGKYKKLVRGIPQSKWVCPSCRGKGCVKCKGTGKLYPTSVQEEIEKPLLKATKAKKSAFHGCIAAGTQVFLNDSSISIEKLEKNWKNYEVMTFNIKRGYITTSKIADFIKLSSREVGLKTYEVTTRETGRKIIATADHQFLTPKGMIPLIKIRVGEKIAVYPIEPSIYHEKKEKIIVSEKDILNTIKRLGKKLVFKTNVNKILRELKERNLLPLSNLNEKILILARILGFLFGDGTVKLLHRGDVGLEFYGNLANLKEIRKDLQKLKYNSYIRKNEKIFSIITDYYGKQKLIKRKHSNYRLVNNSKSLWLLLVTLGAPIGNKTIKNVEIPKWIKESDVEIKKEFLASLLGTEIDKPRIDKRSGKNFSTPRFSINKLENLLDNGIKFIRDLASLLNEFGIKTLKPRLIPYTTRKDGKKTIKICLDFSNKLENLLNLFGKVGFKYAKEKEILARYAYEYLLMKKHFIESRKKIYKIALKLRDGGLTPIEIFRKINTKFVKYKNLAMWLSPKNRNKSFSNIKVTNDFPDFEEWLTNATKNLKNGLVWETVDCMEEIEIPYVYDITTKSLNHTFFANGILVSNSGREDIDARCLDYRPFVIELIKPLKRKINLKEMEKKINKSKKVKVKLLGFANRELVVKIKSEKSEKTYQAEVEFEKEIDKEKMKELKKLEGQAILQKTPTRVLHRRSDKVRKRIVKEISWKLIGRKKCIFKIRAQSGLYIKELISGDQGRTNPSISELISNKPKKIKLDVIKIHKVKR